MIMSLSRGIFLESSTQIASELLLVDEVLRAATKKEVDSQGQQSA